MTSCRMSQGLSKATDISSSDAEIRKKGIELLSKALKVRGSHHLLQCLRWWLCPIRTCGLPQALDKAGGKYFVGVNFGAMDKYREPLSAEQWKNCVASLKVPAHFLHAMVESDGPMCISISYIPWQEVVSEAADMGITYGLEVVNRYETNILNTAVQVMFCQPRVSDGSHATGLEAGQAKWLPTFPCSTVLLVLQSS